MDKSLLFPIIFEWQQLIRSVTGVFRNYEQELYDVLGSKPIKVISGFRRSGKSFLIQKTVSRLIAEKKIQLKNVLYLNFEEHRLSEIHHADKLEPVFRQFLHEIAADGKKLIVMDEIQMVKDWDKFIRTIYEKYQDIEIIITGSNSELLSSEIGSNLAGRFIEIQVLPFDFKEFLLLRGLHISSANDFYEHAAQIPALFNEYLNFGGLPELVSINAEKAKYSYLEGILSKVILDDIIARFHIRHAAIIQQILQYLLLGIGNMTTYSRMVNLMKQAGFEIKQDTVVNYVDCILKTFALYPLDKLEYKQSRVFSSRKKFYAVDTGLVTLYGGALPMYSKLLENAVFLKLKRHAHQLYFGQGVSGKEIDFIEIDRNRHITNYQVTTVLEAANFDRELSSFAAIDKYIATGRNILLTTDQEDEIIEFSKVKVEKRNIIRWLLE
jgi:predicted AAA+ superfamily ATPase